MQNPNDRDYTRRLVEHVLRLLRQEYLPSVTSQLQTQIVNTQQNPAAQPHTFISDWDAAIYASVAAIFQAGTNITLTDNATGHTITIAASGGTAGPQIVFDAAGNVVTDAAGNIVTSGAP